MVAGDADNRLRAQQAAGFDRSAVILAHMNARRANPVCQLRVVVDQQGHAGVAAQAVEVCSLAQPFCGG